MNKIIKYRPGSISPKPNTFVKTICRQPHVSSSVLEQYERGFPISLKVYDQLVVEGSHTPTDNNAVNPVDKHEEYPTLIDPRSIRVQNLQPTRSFSVGQVAQSVSVQNTSLRLTRPGTNAMVNPTSDQSIQKYFNAAQSVSVIANISNHIAQLGANQEMRPRLAPIVQCNRRTPPTFHGQVEYDVNRCVSKMDIYLTLMQETPDQQVNFAVTYLRRHADD